MTKSILECLEGAFKRGEISESDLLASIYMLALAVPDETPVFLKKAIERMQRRSAKYDESFPA